MKIKIPLTYFLTLFSFLFLSATSFAQFRVVGYLPTWTSPASNMSSYDLNKLTHINLAFMNSNTSGVPRFDDALSLSQLATIVSDCHAKSVKVFISLGGAGATATTYQTVFGNTTKMNALVNNLRNYVLTNDLDGVDVDLEGNVFQDDNGNQIVTPAMYESFITKMDTAMHNNGKQLSAALATWFQDQITTTAASKFDWINIMSYDAYGTWTGPGDHSPYSLATSDLTSWKSYTGLTGSKFSVGVPFYGYGWGTPYSTSDEIGYCDIVNTYPGAESQDYQGTIASGNYLSYNGLATIIKKTKYALANASGIMIWEITEDCSSSDHRSLLRAIDSLVHPAVPTAVRGAQLSQDQLTVYPNPSSDQTQLQLNLSSVSNGSIVLCNANGDVLKQLANGSLDAQALIVFSMADYPAGMYVLKLTTDQGSLVKKIAKQ